MKKTLIALAIIATNTMADNPKCENLLAEIRGNSAKITEAYYSGDVSGQTQIMKSSFKTATQAMFTCDDERNKDDLENILNMLGTQLGI